MPSLTKTIKPGSELERRIISEVRHRVRRSERSFQQRRLEWRKAEDEIIGYVHESEADYRRRQKRELEGKPTYTTIHIPYTYGVTMALHTYLASAFLSRAPILQFDGRHGEPQNKVLAVEALHDYQLKAGKITRRLYSWLYDVAKYGVGIVSLYWVKDSRHVSEIILEEDEFGGVRKLMKTLELPGYAGNECTNIQPRDFLCDPRVPMHDFQRGEYCGTRQKISYVQMRQRERQGYYQNGEMVNANISPRFFDERDDDSQVEKPDDEYFDVGERRTTEGSMSKPDIIPIYEMFVELVPSDWGLGRSDAPEKWVFTITADWKVVLGAQPHGAYHCRYPFSLIELEPDAYAIGNRGMPELLKGIQSTMDWLINSHFYNVRASLNNLFLVDPMRVIMKDLTNPRPGGIIRMRPGAAQGARPAVEQLNIADITRNNINDFAAINQLGERASGVNDQFQGVQNRQGRRTATQVRTESVSSVSRQKVISEFVSATGWEDLAYMLVSNSQQYLDEEIALRIIGNLANFSGTDGIVNVDPEMIQGMYDFVPVDGTLPLDRFAQANLWKEILVASKQVPEIGMNYDIGRIFAWIAQLSGLRNIDQFRLVPGSPEQLQAQAQQGNLVPAQAGQRNRDPNQLRQPGNGVGPIPIGGSGGSRQAA